MKCSNPNTCGQSDHQDTNPHHCEGREPLTMRSWNCGEPQPLGPVMHDGHIYENLVVGNISDPALGVGQGTYAGAFDLGSYIAYKIANS